MMSCLATGKSVEHGLNLRPADLLSRRPGSVYTTARVTRSREVVDWHLHIARLTRSVELLHDRRGSFGKLLQRYNTERLLTSYMERAAGRVTTQAVEGLFADDTRSFEDEKGRSALFLLVSEDDVEDGVDVMAYCCFMPATYHTPLRVEVLGPPRDIPGAKHTNWVIDRRRLEAARSPGIEEVILSTPEGELLEGLTTNFYVVADSGDGGGGPELYTSAGDGRSLPGIMQQRVMASCAAAGVRVAGRPPSVHQRGFWREAFVTNCLRGVQPVSFIRTHPDAAQGEAAWEVTLPECGPVTRALQGAVQAQHTYTRLEDTVAT